MKLTQLMPAAGATKPAYRRVRRWFRAMARPQVAVTRAASGGVRPGFEGGQMPRECVVSTTFSAPLTPVNVSALEKFEDGAEVTAEILDGIVKNALDGIKILGTGTLTQKKLNRLSAAAFSASATEIRSRRRKGPRAL